MNNRLQYTFVAAVNTVLTSQRDVARGIGRASATLSGYRSGRRNIPIAVARALVTHLRRQAKQLETVARALDRAADVAERSSR